jgi:acetyltransferase-like isoleucine patch superfamily enzyme
MADTLMRKFKKVVGMLLYRLLASVDFVHFVPTRIGEIFESLKVYSLKIQGATIGGGTKIRTNVFIAHPRNLKVGNNVTIGSYSRIYNYTDFVVGDECELGPGLHVQTNDHIWKEVNKPIGKQGVTTGQVKIGKGVFIGANVTLLKGIEIGDFVVIGAGSVVNKNITSGFLAGGVPVRVIREVYPKLN